MPPLTPPPTEDLIGHGNRPYKPRQVCYLYRCLNRRCGALHHGGSSARRCPICKLMSLSRLKTVRSPIHVKLRIAR